MKKFYFIALSFIGMLTFAQIPNGYYSGIEGLSKEALKTKLGEIITRGHSDRSYNGLWTAYETTDIDQFYEGDGSILDIYSENPAARDPYNFKVNANKCGNYQVEGDCYNREHIVPQSLFSERSPMKNDVHFIRATDGKVNGVRGSLPFGVVRTPNYTSKNGSKRGNSASAGYSGDVFEPIDEFKGDVARMVFYFVTRYGNQLSTFKSGNMLGSGSYPGLRQWQLDVLLEWHAQDPVSETEIARNNASYTFQGNRNPYIDHPELVALVWKEVNNTSDNIPPTAPKNLKTTNVTANSIEINWEASTDNVAVSSYDIYVDGVLKMSVNAGVTSAVLQNLTGNTTYTIHIVAKDRAGNVSENSNTVTATTNEETSNPVSTTCGTEDFSGIGNDGDSSYTEISWSNNNITWTATDARGDQKINDKAITIRNGKLASSTISGGIGSLTVTTLLQFTGSNGEISLLVNGNEVGKIPYSKKQTTTTINNINIEGNVVIELVNSNRNRISIDDLSWTCYNALATEEVLSKNTIKIYPNPIKHKQFVISGFNGLKEVNIYNLNGQIVQKIQNVRAGQTLTLKNLPKGVYVVGIDGFTSKVIVE